MLRNLLLHIAGMIVVVGGCAAYAYAQPLQPPVQIFATSDGYGVVGAG